MIVTYLDQCPTNIFSHSNVNKEYVCKMKLKPKDVPPFCQIFLLSQKRHVKLQLNHAEWFVSSHKSLKKAFQEIEPLQYNNIEIAGTKMWRNERASMYRTDKYLDIAARQYLWS